MVVLLNSHSQSEISKLQTLLPFLGVVQDLVNAHHSLKCEIGSLAVKMVATELSLLALKVTEEFFIYFLLAES